MTFFRSGAWRINSTAEQTSYFLNSQKKNTPLNPNEIHDDSQKNTTVIDAAYGWFLFLFSFYSMRMSLSLVLLAISFFNLNSNKRSGRHLCYYARNTYRSFEDYSTEFFFVSLNWFGIKEKTKQKQRKIQAASWVRVWNERQRVRMAFECHVDIDSFVDAALVVIFNKSFNQQ